MIQVRTRTRPLSVTLAQESDHRRDEEVRLAKLLETRGIPYAEALYRASVIMKSPGVVRAMQREAGQGA